jgi:hypothetical protein
VCACVRLSEGEGGKVGEEAPAEFFEGSETNAKLLSHGLLGQVKILGQLVKLHLLVVRGASSAPSSAVAVVRWRTRCVACE